MLRREGVRRREPSGRVTTGLPGLRLVVDRGRRRTEEDWGEGGEGGEERTALRSSSKERGELGSESRR